MNARTWLPPLSVALVAIAVYAGSLFNGFVLDDHQAIEANPIVTGDLSPALALFQPYRAQSPYPVFRPLTTLSFAAQWAIHGPAPWAFHLANVLLHAVVSVLVLSLARTILPGQPLASYLAALLFAVHTIHTDAVSSVVGRAEVMTAGFAIASLLAWHKFMTQRGAESAALASLTYLLALLSKETAGPLPLFAAIMTARRPCGRTRLLWQMAFGLPLALYLALRLNALGALFSVQARYFEHIDTWHTFLTMVGVLARYTALLIVPYPLSPDYSFDSIPVAQHVLEPWTAAGLVILPGMLLACFLTRSNAIGTAIAFFLVFMLPALNIVPLMVPMAERIAYLASAGFCLLAGQFLAWAASRYRVAGSVLAAAWLLALSGLTVERDQVWHDDVTLFSDAVKVHPRCALSLANLGQALLAEGRTEAAVAALHKAIEIGPWKWEFRVALADILHDSGLHRDEADLLLDGLRYGGGKVPDKRRLCAALVETGQFTDEATCMGTPPGPP